MIKWVERYIPEKGILKGRAYHITKRGMDIAVVLMAMPFLAPVLIACAAAVKLDSPDGPIFFMQPRTGRGGRRFSMYKFRTMVPNAEELKIKYAHLNKLKWPDFKIDNDPRITRVGKILRKTSLDELPQVINILKGEMSLVGPRPTSFGPETYKLWHTERLDVTPGLTGVWQVISRAESEFDDRLTLDIAYINHRCLSLDIEILVRTVLAVIKQKGAV